MMTQKYYCLVAGSPDLTLDMAKPPLKEAQWREDLYRDLTPADKKLIDLVYMDRDNRRFLDLLSGRDADANLDTDLPLGLYTDDELIEAIRQARKGENSGRKLPDYFYRFVLLYDAWRAETPSGELVMADGRLPEDVLAGLYYDFAGSQKNSFVSRWFAFSRTARNVLVALTARNHGLEIAPYLVGDGPVEQALSHSGARDFGLSSDVENLDVLLQIGEVQEPVEKERRLDALRWNWLEEQEFFHYFTVERIFAYTVKLEIISRWAALDAERGAEQLRSLVDGLKKAVEVPSEFRL